MSAAGSNVSETLKLLTRMFPGGLSIDAQRIRLPATARALRGGASGAADASPGVASGLSTPSRTPGCFPVLEPFIRALCPGSWRPNLAPRTAPAVSVAHMFEHPRVRPIRTYRQRLPAGALVLAGAGLLAVIARLPF